jgi:hypothetical protein
LQVVVQVVAAARLAVVAVVRVVLVTQVQLLYQ